MTHDSGKTVTGTPYLVPGAQYFVLYAVLMTSTAMLVGCGHSSPPVRPASEAANSTKVQLVHADGKALEELIATHKGQVLLVDYWATWCGPCVENFPHTVRLAKKYRERGLVAIAVSFDLFEDEPKVSEFLAKQQADFENLISEHNSVGQKAFGDFDIGPLPEYRLYDRQGKLGRKWEGGVDQAELEKKIEELLAEKA